MLVHYASPPTPRGQDLSLLRQQIAAVELSTQEDESKIVSSGCPGLDQLLPQGGFKQPSLVEWLSANRSGGAQTLALVAAREACQAGKSLVVVDRPRRFYPPAAAAWGIDLSRLIVIHPASEADELWAIDQALRCRGVAAVWARREQLDSRDFRRLQLAAESGGTLGLLIRSARARGEPSWADVQLAVSPRPSSGGWRLGVEVTRCRGSHPGQSVELEIDEWTGRIKTRSASEGAIPTRSASEGIARHETHPLRPAAQLAPPAAGRLVAV